MSDDGPRRPAPAPGVEVRKRTTGEVYLIEGHIVKGGMRGAAVTGRTRAPAGDQEGGGMDVNELRGMLAEIMSGQVLVTGPTEGQGLVYNGSAHVWENRGLDAMVAPALETWMAGAFSAGVFVVSPTTGDFLTYSWESHTWTNAPLGSMVGEYCNDHIANLFSGAPAITAPQDGDLLVYVEDPGEWQNMAQELVTENQVKAALAAVMLGPLTISSVTNGDTVYYDAEAEAWVNGPINRAWAAGTEGFLARWASSDELGCWTPGDPIAVPAITCVTPTPLTGFYGGNTVDAPSLAWYFGELQEKIGALVSAVNSLGTAVGAIVEAMVAAGLVSGSQ